MEGGGIRSYYLAKFLMENNHQVRVVTAHNNLKGHHVVDGISITYLKIPYHNAFPFAKRIRSFIEFVLFAIFISGRTHKADLNYIITTPLSTGLIALYLKFKKRIPYVFEVGDLWPEVPVQLGFIRRSFSKNIFYSFEKYCYSKANIIVALSPSIQDYIDKKIDRSVKTIVIENMSNCETFRPISNFPKAFDKKKPFKICYIGTIGIANEIENLVDFSKACEKANLPIETTIMGNGGRKKEIELLCLKASSIVMKDHGNYSEVVRLLNESHAIYVSFQDVNILHTGCPNKFFDGLSAGKLIILNFSGWLREIVEKNNCGFYQNPKDLNSSLKKVTEFLNIEKLRVASSNSRQLAEFRFNKDLLCVKWYRSVIQGFVT